MTNTKFFKILFLESGKYSSYQDLAKDLGMSVSSLSRKINNKGSSFSISEIKKLQELMELNHDQIFKLFFA